ncbi:hypothetical protein PHYSODRAFT_341220 [Phytophthora sojae]|uniref:Tc1-like transposase DDE domain-containing protein n=1 Tax=Phytophthora sojae (strain P6497) TaxID=1094619 RepID=G5ACI7_PHYSP|nr:hypothetical protein PHYSODRAFT_341220 [Phytophthora sojae]EGZ07061.1 hypothetical protein PHYSODRAFT_341220 [Phytophthora sojae]|eukprot:XP_009537825.1 hypothetical protein PHYSODRAFT_341220 [Phytophthora sojae]
MGKTYTDAERARVLAATDEGENWRLIALHNGVHLVTARRWVQQAKQTGDFMPQKDMRGGAYNRKLQSHHIDFLEDVRVGIETVRANLEARCFTAKKTHRDNNYRNVSVNKVKRQEFAMKLLQYGWSKAGRRAVDMGTSSKSKNIHVIACISRDGVEYHEGRFGSFDSEAANETLREGPLSNVIVVLDNAPCHMNVEDVCEEAEFAGAECLRLGPYSPMLNGIENVFSVYKAAVKRYMAANRSSILSVPEGTKIAVHRSAFLLHAANVIFPEVVTLALCSKCIHHTFAFIADAILMKDMQAGKQVYQI